MSLDRRLRQGFEGSSSAIEERSIDHVLDGVVARGRRRRRVRRVAAGTLALAAFVAAVVIAPKALDAIRSLGETRPASPQDLMRQIAGTYTIEVHRSNGAIEAYDMAGTWTISLLPTGAMMITPPPAYLRSWDQPTGDVFTVAADTIRTNVSEDGNPMTPMGLVEPGEMSAEGIALLFQAINGRLGGELKAAEGGGADLRGSGSR
jgi:hypothetical protein